jgi:aspartate/tyrosine/aromatic aminotransferase
LQNGNEDCLEGCVLTPFQAIDKSHTCVFWTGNHKNILNDAGVPWSEYHYFDPKTVGLDFEGMIADIKVRLSG